MQKTKTQKGITLVALIITIIVLLILAVVAIQAVTGDGIIQHAKNATTQTNLAQEREELQLEVLNWRLVNDAVGTTLVEHFQGKYTTENVQENADESITVTLESGNKYVITEDGIITYLDGTVEEPAPKPDPSITLDITSIEKVIASGETETVTLTATLVNATGNLTWSTSNDEVAVVSGTDETGTVILNAVTGTAVITVSYGDVSATCTIKVTKKISFTIDGTTYYAEEGMTWAEWIETDYNIENLFSCDSSGTGDVRTTNNDGNTVWLAETSAEDEIQGGASYVYFAAISGGSAD